MTDPDPRIDIPENVWRPCVSADGFEPEAFMVATIVINGTPCHLSAIQVARNEDNGFQEAVYDDESFGLIHAGLGADGPWMTTTIKGREYVLIAEPYGG